MNTLLHPTFIFFSLIFLIQTIDRGYLLEPPSLINGLDNVFVVVVVVVVVFR